MPASPIDQHHQIWPYYDSDHQPRIAVLLVSGSSTECSACALDVLDSKDTCSSCGALFVAEQCLKIGSGRGGVPAGWTRMNPRLPYFDAYGERITQ